MLHLCSLKSQPICSPLSSFICGTSEEIWGRQCNSKGVLFAFWQWYINPRWYRRLSCWLHLSGAEIGGERYVEGGRKCQVSPTSLEAHKSLCSERQGNRPWFWLFNPPPNGWYSICKLLLGQNKISGSWDNQRSLSWSQPKYPSRKRRGRRNQGRQGKLCKVG